jgi:hypothetical protein
MFSLLCRLVLNLPAITKAMNIKQNQLKVVRERGYHVIKGGE